MHEIEVLNGKVAHYPSKKNFHKMLWFYEDVLNRTIQVDSTFHRWLYMCKSTCVRML